MTLFRAVTAYGTGAAVSQLNHPLGGKTGTTSEYTDAWFLGFSPSVTCGVWVGFDSRESLGEKETGARAALPIWITFMKAAIVGKDDEQFLADQDSQLDRAAAATSTSPQPAVATVTPAQPPRPVYAPSHFFPATASGGGNGTVTRDRTVGSTASPSPHP